MAGLSQWGSNLDSSQVRGESPVHSGLPIGVMLFCVRKWGHCKVHVSSVVDGNEDARLSQVGKEAHTREARVVELCNG